MTLSREHKCWIFAGSLLLVGLLVVSAVLLPWWHQLQQYRDKIDGAAEQIATYRSLIASEQAVRRANHQFWLHLKKSNLFIDAENTDLAAAQLQTKVKQIVAASGGTLVSTQNLGAGSDAGKVVVRVRLKGDVEALTKVIHAIEDHRPLLLIEDLDIRSRKTVRGRRGSRRTIFSLDADLSLAALYWENGA